MKILLAGGGSGGHFYPIIAVAEQIQEVAKEKRLVDIELYYMADRPYNSGLLFDKGIIFKKTYAGKMRTYFSILNITDVFKTGIGVVKTFFTIFRLYPDVVFGKGGYVSFPALFAARLLRIPVVIHESDSVPGRVNKWAGKFAKRIAISYPEAAQYFNKDKVALTGNPVRKEIMIPVKKGARDFLEFSENLPVLLIMGGSQGSQLINDIVLDALPELVKKYQIIHQTGKTNFAEVKETADVVLRESQFKSRYRPFDYLNDLAIRMSAGAANLIISRAGSTIFEIALWGVPSIIIPITRSNGDHQRKNAFSYARAGACEVIEEHNLAPHILVSEIDKMLSSEAQNVKALGIMSSSAKAFARPDAAYKIAEEIVLLALAHEK
jgi:UDP-N-acetylglucosamine--N-acetylmuramyl-(pentapeptide) pyrophosphoryl-undecaprenol N-acetylglucosamine transferase